MKITAPAVDYRKLRPNNLTSPEFRHILLLIYWPLFLIFFQILERVYVVDYYYPMHCPLDDLIPFHEIFVIPYLLWFAFIISTLLYGFFYDVDLFKREMYSIIITYTAALVIFFIFPNCQQMRPLSFERDNILTRFMADFYQFDTNTNVFPSIHVMGAMCSMFAAWWIKPLRHPVWKIAAALLCLFICMSTVFLKQHSILDTFGALPICAFAYWFCFMRGKVKAKECVDSSAV